MIIAVRSFCIPLIVKQSKRSHRNAAAFLFGHIIDQSDWHSGRLRVIFLILSSAPAEFSTL